MVAQARVRKEKVDDLHKSLEEAQSILNGMQERVSQLMNDTVVASILHFEEGTRKIYFLYPHIDLVPLYPFKVVLDGDLVDK